MGYFDFEDEGWFEEEDLLTNFSGSQLPLYEKAVKEFGDNTLYISDMAFDCMGRKLKGDYSLRVTEYRNRSEFWQFFDGLRDEIIA